MPKRFSIRLFIYFFFLNPFSSELKAYVRLCPFDSWSKKVTSKVKPCARHIPAKCMKKKKIKKKREIDEHDRDAVVRHVHNIIILHNRKSYAEFPTPRVCRLWPWDLSPLGGRDGCDDRSNRHSNNNNYYAEVFVFQCACLRSSRTCNARTLWLVGWFCFVFYFHIDFFHTATGTLRVASILYTYSFSFSDRIFNFRLSIGPQRFLSVRAVII